MRPIGVPLRARAYLTGVRPGLIREATSRRARNSRSSAVPASECTIATLNKTCLTGCYRRSLPLAQRAARDVALVCRNSPKDAVLIPPGAGPRPPWDGNSGRFRRAPGSREDVISTAPREKIGRLRCYNRAPLRTESSEDRALQKRDTSRDGGVSPRVEGTRRARKVGGRSWEITAGAIAPTRSAGTPFSARISHRVNQRCTTTVLGLLLRGPPFSSALADSGVATPGYRIFALCVSERMRAGGARACPTSGIFCSSNKASRRHASQAPSKRLRSKSALSSSLATARSLNLPKQYCVLSCAPYFMNYVVETPWGTVGAPPRTESLVADIA